MKYLAGCVISNFSELARLCRNDPLFPHSVDEWSALMATASNSAMRDNYQVQPYALDPLVFEKWCSLVGIVPGLEALRAYLIVQRAAVARHA